MKLVARAGKSPEPRPLEAVVCLQVREAHFNTLPFVSRLGKRLCLHLPSCDIAGVLMDIARDLARIGLVQHFARIGHTSQSRFEARYSSVRPSCTVPLVLSSFPFGQM